MRSPDQLVWVVRMLMEQGTASLPMPATEHQPVKEGTSFSVTKRCNNMAHSAAPRTYEPGNGNAGKHGSGNHVRVARSITFAVSTLAEVMHFLGYRELTNRGRTSYIE